MRRFDEDDEVDLVVVGAGAGGSVLTQRLARAGWRVVTLDAGPFWDPDADWVSDERGSHGLYWTEPRQIGGERPGAAGVEQLRPRCRRLDGPLRRLHAPASTRRTSAPPASTASARTGRSPTPTCRATTRRSRRSCRSPGRTGRGETRTPTRTTPTRSAATGRCSCVAPQALGHPRAGRPGRDHQRPVRQPTALHLPRLLPAGLQGQRQGQPADHPHPRRPRARRRGPARLRMSPGCWSTTTPVGRPASTYMRGRGRAPATGRMVAVAGYSIETPRLLLLSATAALAGRAWATTTTRSAAT